MVKRKVLKIFILAMSLVFVLSSFAFCAMGCKIFTDLEVYRDGFFKYIVVEESGNVSNKNNNEAIAIIGFTGSGMQQEVIDFPREIDGKPVRYISYRDISYFSEAYYELESSNLKKVYIHENIEHVYRDAFSGITDRDNLEIMFCAPKDPFEIFAERIYLDSKVYLYKSVYDSTIFSGSNMCVANVVFLDNYSIVVNDSYYSMDNVKTGEKIVVPPIPARNGYEFTGWYTEPECINAWNFEVVPTIEENAEFRLYAGWRNL